MKRHGVLLTVALLGSLLAGPARASDTAAVEAAIAQVQSDAAAFLESTARTPDGAVEFAYIFAGGGTPLTNGVFSPGTAICDGGGCTYLGPIPQVSRGTDITFVNLDSALVANEHRIVCKKKRKNGKPVCYSEQLGAPGQTSTLPTAKLKPGIYDYVCSVHFGMYGAFEVIP